MLEIIFVIFLTRKLAGMAEERGQSKMWGGLGAAFWVGGEVLGFIFAVVALELALNDPAAYGIALIGAVIGATAAFFIVNGLEERLDDFDEPHADHGLVGSGDYDIRNPYEPPGGHS